jgi:hypothetical protein
LGRLKYPSALPYAALHHPPWDYGIVFALRRDTAETPGGGRSFHSCIYASSWPIEGGDYGYVYTWLDPQRRRHSFGYGSLRSLAVLAPRSAWPMPLVPSSSVGTSAWMGALANIVHDIRRGLPSSPPSGRPGRSLTTLTDLPQLLRLGMGGPRAYSIFHPNYGFIPVAAAPVDGTVATAARRMVATSEGGGRPCRQSRPLRRGLFIAYTQHKQLVTSISSCSCRPWRWWAQVTASQQLLVRRQWRRRHTVATGRRRRLFLGWGMAGSAAAGWHRLSSAMGSRFIV